MVQLSRVDRGTSPPDVHIPGEYNAAHDLIERNLAARRGPKLAYIDDSGEYTYDELARRVNRFAKALTDLDVRQEERILLCLPDSIDFPTAFLGAIKAGGWSCRVCWAIPTALSPGSCACAAAPRPARRCPRRSAASGRPASASTSSTASVPRRCCTSSSPIVPAKCATAAPASRCPATKCAWSATTACRCRSARSANFRSAAPHRPSTTGTRWKRAATPSRAGGRAAATSIR